LRVITEKSFGYPVPVKLRIGTQALYVHGRIDRIETAGQKAIIRDLKTARAHSRTGAEAEPTPALDVQIAVYGLIAELLSQEWKLPQRIEAGYAYFGRPSGERLFGADFQTVLKPAANQWLQTAINLLTERQFPRTPNKEDCSYCSFKAVCGEDVYSRATLLLSQSSGALTAFANLKMVLMEEP
jgi:ATP-dependent helicase/DNAse subunit B